jgi:hypothetical protein
MAMLAGRSFSPRTYRALMAGNSGQGGYSAFVSWAARCSSRTVASGVFNAEPFTTALPGS